MARETKAEREIREAKELKAQERAKKAAEKKALKEKESQEPKVITVDFSESTKNLLRDLVDAMLISSNNLRDAHLKSNTKTEKIEKSKPEVSHVHVSNSNTQSAPVSSSVSLTKIRETINVKAGENKTAAMLELLGKYGATSASTLQEENYDEFYEALQKL